jgi:hypothetical protein
MVGGCHDSESGVSGYVHQFLYQESGAQELPYSPQFSSYQVQSAKFSNVGIGVKRAFYERHKGDGILVSFNACD